MMQENELPLHKFRRRRGQIALRKCITTTATIIRIITMGIIIIVGAGIMVTTVTTSGHSRRSENRERLLSVLLVP